jgi:hypothetical protein
MKAPLVTSQSGNQGPRTKIQKPKLFEIGSGDLVLTHLVWRFSW